MRRSYTPPPVRRKIQSPFLSQVEPRGEARVPVRRHSDAPKLDSDHKPAPCSDTSSTIPSPPSEVAQITSTALDDLEHPEVSQTQQRDFETPVVAPPTPIGATDRQKEAPPAAPKPTPAAAITSPEAHPQQQPTQRRVQISIPERDEPHEGHQPEMEDVHINGTPHSQSLVYSLKETSQTEPVSTPEKEGTGNLLSPSEDDQPFYRMRSASDITQMKRPLASSQAYFTKAGRISTRPVHQGILPEGNEQSKVRMCLIRVCALYKTLTRLRECFNADFLNT